MYELTREEWIDIIPIIAAAFLALLGWVVTYLHKWYFDNKANQLNRVTRQLKELYGPLYIRLMASKKTWEAFWEKHQPGHGQSTYFAKGVKLSDEELAIWRNWMINVFEPMNEKTEAVIMNHIDLMDSPEIPAAFVEALAHIAAYKAVLAKWENNDFSEHVSVNNWPSEALLEIVKPEFERLKALQKDLLNV